MKNVSESRCYNYLKSKGFDKKLRLMELFIRTAKSDDGFILELPSYMKPHKKYFTVKSGKETKGQPNWYKVNNYGIIVINDMKEYFSQKQ